MDVTGQVADRGREVSACVDRLLVPPLSGQALGHIPSTSRSMKVKLLKSTREQQTMKWTYSWGIRFPLVVIAISVILPIGSLVSIGMGSPMGKPMANPKCSEPQSAGNQPVPLITSEEAHALAINNLVQIGMTGYRLRHPRHTAIFSRDGLRFQPRLGGPEWGWQLCQVTAGGDFLEGIEVGPVTPMNDVPGTVRYGRGGIDEQYVLKSNSIEQQFLIPQPLDTDGESLTITGTIECSGDFESSADGWIWRTPSGFVGLGDVSVVDATGKLLPATLAVDSNSTQIVIDGMALARATYPVIIDPEIVGEALRISDMGPNGTLSFKAQDPAVAYNSVDNEYLVVWSGDDDTGALVDDEYEIFGQRIDATTGEEVGPNDFRISSMGANDGDEAFDAYFPDVAYNSTSNEYLVVWVGNDGTGSLAREEFEIYGQRLTADGREIGADDFRVSDMGPDGNSAFEVKHPVVAYNSVNNEYLVAWVGEDNTGALVDGEFEIFGQRVTAEGNEIGANDFRISDMGTADGDDGYDADTPDIAYNGANNEYLVVWAGDDDTGALVDHEDEIFGQRIEGATGTEIGANDFRISDMGSTDGDTIYDAQVPRIAYNTVDNEYLVIWTGDDDTGMLVDRENEVYGQRIDAANGTEIGANDFRISHMGTNDGDDSFDADDADVTYNSVTNEYLIVWEGIDDSGELIPGEKEIRGQRLDGATGAEVGVDDCRISDMGSVDGDTRFDAYSPKVTCSSGSNEYLVIWEGEDDVPPLVRLEFEALGQRLDGATGAEVGINDFRISDMGPNGNEPYAAFESAVAYNSIHNEYLVVWSGHDDTDPLVHGEMEIFGQRIDARTCVEIGINDFRISDMGPNGSIAFEARTPSVAFNPVNDEYLVVWSGDDNTGSLVDGEYEVYGQRLDGATGAELGMNDFRVSDMGPDGDDRFGAVTPQVEYNGRDLEYLVVWAGNDDSATLNGNEVEIYGQRLDATTGGELGVNDFRISDMGPEGIASSKASEPALAYNSTNNEYLVVWSGDDATGLLVDNEYEVYGQRLDAATGAEIGANDFRISDMGTSDGNDAFDASDPDVAYDNENNGYLVVWSGDDDTDLLADNEAEIYGQRLDAATGAEIGVNDFRISDAGDYDGNDAFDAKRPRVVYNRSNDVYLVVWEGDDDTGTLVENEKEIFGQRLDAASGKEVGTNDFRISYTGPNGSKQFSALRPAVAYCGPLDSYLVVWEGDDDRGDLEDDEVEIFGLGFTDGEEIVPIEQRSYGISQNAPNPFNRSTEIRFVIPEDGDVVIKIYNVAGRLVRTLVSADLRKGVYTERWDARDQNGRTVASGAYLCNITVYGESGSLRYSQTQVMTYLK